MELLGLFAFFFCLYLLIAPLIAWVQSNTAKSRAEEATAQLRAQALLVKELQRQISGLRDDLKIAVARWQGSPADAAASTPPATDPSTQANEATMLDERGAVVPSDFYEKQEERHRAERAERAAAEELQRAQVAQRMQLAEAARLRAAAERLPKTPQRSAAAYQPPPLGPPPLLAEPTDKPLIAAIVKTPDRLPPNVVPGTNANATGLPSAETGRPKSQNWELEPVEEAPSESSGRSVFSIGIDPEVPTTAANTQRQTASTSSVETAPFVRAPSAESSEHKPVWTPKPPRGTAGGAGPPPAGPYVPPQPSEPSDFERTLAAMMAVAKQWLFGGNLVAKIGLLILFIGIAFLLRLASSYVEVPIEVRLAGIAAGAIALLLWGWRIRERRPGIALPVQGAALAILMMVTFGAFKLYALIPAGPTFALLLILVAFTCILAVLQDALWLAIFGISGGFAVPILLSTGGGSHIALFSYYALLNAGILAIALRRSWRVLNVLGFLFTFVIGTAWGVRSYEPEFYQSSQAFLILFLLFYIAIAIIYAWREAPRLKSYVDGTLVFGVPTVAMGLQYALVKDVHLGMAFSALGLGLLYALTASVLWKLKRENLRLLVESFFALAVVFGTLAIPLAFDGRWTSAAWALEGAAIIWIGLRQRQPLVWRFGVLVQIGSWVAFLNTLIGFDVVAALASNIGLGFLLLGASGVFLGVIFRQHLIHDNDIDSTARARYGRFANTFIVIAVAWLLAGMWIEIWLRTRGFDRATLYVLTALGLVFGLQFLGRRTRWTVPDTLSGVVTAIAGVTFLVLMGRYMDWSNIPVYAQTSLAQMLGNSSFFGGLLLSGGALVSAFAFKRRIADLEKDVLDSSGATRASVMWYSLAMFWWCGFALHGLAHVIAWLTAPVAGTEAAWYQISFWAAYSIGLALSAWAWTRVAERQSFAHARSLVLGFWPIATGVSAWAFLVQVADRSASDHILEFAWNIGAPGVSMSQVLRDWLGGPLLGALILVMLAWQGVKRSRDDGSLALSVDQRMRSVAIWLSGLAVCWYLPIVDGLAQLLSRALSAAGIVSDAGSAQPWLGYADAHLLWMSASAMMALLLAKKLALPALRWLATPTAIIQALGTLVLLGMLNDQGQLPTAGTALSTLAVWLAMAWCLRFWQAAGWDVHPLSLRGLHFGRVIGPWMMISPVVALYVALWLAQPVTTPVDSGSWIVAGMWADYLGAWAAIGALFLLLRQARVGAWPVRPLEGWYIRWILPMGAAWALLLAIYWNLRQDGNMAPLPYLPILNPLDLTTGFVALLLADVWRTRGPSVRWQLAMQRLAMFFAFAWFNLMLLRTAAAYLGLPYRFDDLYASQFVQAMLSLVWTLSAFGLMRFAVRRLSKPLWMLGAALLAVVVLKLFLIDLKNVGSVARIVSFMGVGGLMLLIGYLAPLPRETERDGA